MTRKGRAEGSLKAMTESYSYIMHTTLPFTAQWPQPITSNMALAFWKGTDKCILFYPERREDSDVNGH